MQTNVYMLCLVQYSVSDRYWFQFSGDQLQHKFQSLDTNMAMQKKEGECS